MDKLILFIVAFLLSAFVLTPIIVAIVKNEPNLFDWYFRYIDWVTEKMERR